MFGLAYVISMAASVGIPLMLTVQFHVGMFQMFIPLMGRSGSSIPPDIAIGLLTCFCVSSATPHMVSLKKRSDLYNNLGISLYNNIIICIN